ncbi:MAG: Z1 domain-containing protein [Elusimicrobia bacterium]|nr:Z1 domain-containing protein [Elusimicrobiota bacterium]
MPHLNDYFGTLSTKREYPSLRVAIENTVNNVLPKINNRAQTAEPVGLLLGNVQSGKTGHIFGVIAAAADAGYKIFILTTTDNVRLQEQTFRRAISSLPTFTVCSENDELRLQAAGLSKPVLIVLKKNKSVLGKWKKYLAVSKICEGQPLIIVDDEADASSLNTEVNKQDLSQIHKHLKDIRALSADSIFIQVTATPQALILQTNNGFRPLFIHYFNPGDGYIGGNFVYSDPVSSCIRIIDENELDNIRQEDQYIPEGLKQAVMVFLVTGADIILSGGQKANFLIHPSVKIADHGIVARKIEEFLNSLFAASMDELEDGIKNAWIDLQRTKPDIKPLDEVKKFLGKVLEDQEINIETMNSLSGSRSDFENGLNIIIGGNTLGRGVTFPALQTVYYCRQAKAPQADTYWQHCRMFGYDRERALMRVYTPSSLLKLFTDLNQANTALIKQVTSGNLESIHLIYPPKIKPTRTNVLDKTALVLIPGGVNFFPFNIAEEAETTSQIDELLKDFADGLHEVDVDTTVNILKKIKMENDTDWNPKSFINALKAWKITKEPGATKCKLLIRRDRDIAKGTGTMLSPNDRSLGEGITDMPILTMYRLIGQTEKRWKGSPLWLPNIKFPEGKIFYKTDK